MQVIRVAIFAAALAVLSPTTASAQSIAQTLRDFGLLDGPLAPDCAQKPSPTNWYGRYSMLPSGEAQIAYNSGTRGENVYLVHAAERIAPDQLLLSQEYKTTHAFLTLIILKNDSKFRTQVSRKPNGVFQVKDGKFADSDRDSPWLSRCGP